MQEVGFESRDLAHNVPRFLLECAYPIQDPDGVFSSQGAREGLSLPFPLPAGGCPRRTSGLHELLLVAAKRIAFAVLVTVHAYALATGDTGRHTTDARAATDLALQGSRARLCGWASAPGCGHRAGIRSGRARSLAVGMRDACVWCLGVGLGRVRCYVLARFGDMRTCDAALLARQAGTSFFADAAAASTGAQVAGNGPLPDTIGELLLLKTLLQLSWQNIVTLSLT
jgi:hypothetical protein